METLPTGPWNLYSEQCPTRMILDRIADKWTVLIIMHLSTGTRRFGELRRTIGGISPKVLTQTLRELERDGIVMRRVYASVPPKVEYWLTPLGCTLGSLVDAINNWAMTHINEVLVAQHEFDQRAQAVVEEH
ncbi:MAG: hypothetical protein Fur005_03010 [Roseiflexaceae bacterium]